MKLITLNVWQGRLERVLLKHLEIFDSDFACMQEAVMYDGESGGLVSSYPKVGNSLKLPHQFFSSLSAMKLGASDITFGNVVYSRYPFSQTETNFTRGRFTPDFDFNSDDYNIRAFQHTRVDIEGKTLHILNHHGHHIDSHKLGDEETLRQVTQICDYIRELEGAVILCGDFNLAPESKSIQLIGTMLRNLPVEAGLTTTRSKLTTKNVVCDYIFANDRVDVRTFSMDETIVSDHNILMLDFELK